jgi:hypothetical protein
MSQEPSKTDAESLNERLSAAIGAEMKRQGMESAAELATRAGIDVQIIRRALRGEVCNPSFENLASLLWGFKRPWAWLDYALKDPNEPGGSPPEHAPAVEHGTSKATKAGTNGKPKAMSRRPSSSSPSIRKLARSAAKRTAAEGKGPGANKPPQAKATGSTSNGPAKGQKTRPGAKGAKKATPPGRKPPRHAPSV